MGNSGVSGGPHLHFSVASREWMSLPAVFTGLLARRRKSGAAWKKATTFEMGYEFRYDEVVDRGKR